MSSPLTGLELARVAVIEEKNENSEAALEGADLSFQQIQKGFFPLPERLEFLKNFHARLQNNSESFVHHLIFEVGKPVDLARVEVARALRTLEWTQIEAHEIFKSQGLPMKSFGENQESWGFFERVPRGPLLAITPFNFPLNLVLHKIAPALAAGCPVILKPSNKALLTALAIADAAHASHLPPGLLSVLPCSDALTHELCHDPRIKQVSFTGSQKVGWELARGLTKPIFLELGGQAPVFVDEGTDLKRAVGKILTGAFAYAGQVCISIQNIYVHKKISEAFDKELNTGLEEFPWGDAELSGVQSSVVIDEAAALRLQNLESHFLQEGGQALKVTSQAQGFGSRENFGRRMIRPQLFKNLPAQSQIFSEEIFAPWASLEVIADLEEFIDRANANQARLQAALFTSSLSRAQFAANRLHYGGVLINESPSYRLEPMPYGGVGKAGSGREGPYFAMKSFTEEKTILVRA